MHSPSTLARHTAGWQSVLDLYDCAVAWLDDLPWVRMTLLRAAQIAQATIVTDSFHKFAPQGISGVVVIAESHIAIHTWPERSYAAVDVFTCNSAVHVQAAVDFLIGAFRSANPHLASFTRGDHRLIPVTAAPMAQGSRASVVDFERRSLLR